jgi:colanic acid/amylovoran biosynthesis glycosyltransferase
VIDLGADPGEGTRHRPTVAHVNYSFFHSTQSFIYFYLSRLREVQPICLTRDRESPAIREEIPPELAENFYIYRSGQDGTRSQRAVRRGGLRLRRLLSHVPPSVADPALSVLHQRIVPRMRPDADPRGYLDWAEEVMRRREVRLIHAYFGPVGWRMLDLRRRLRVPLVVTFLGDDIAPSLAPWWSWWIQSGSGPADWPMCLAELFEQADLLLAEGPFLRQKLIDLGCPAEKLEVQRFGIPVEEMPFRARRAQPGGRAVIVFAGRLCEQKGVIYALEAVRRLRDQGRDLEFRLIGDDTLTDGRYAARVHAYIRAHDLGECIRLLGFLNYSEYIEELQRGDIFLHPSVVDDRGTSEGGAPTTIIEAQALGMPVVSTQHCDIPNVTLPGDSALLVPERDSEALAGALAELLDDPDSWARMGRAGRRQVEERHDIAKEAARLERRYLALLESTERGPNPTREPGVPQR